LGKTDSIDVSDAVGVNIRLDTRGREVLRVLPRLNEDVNEEWMADKGRFSVDGLMRQRLDRPYVRVEGKLKPATWPEAFAAISAKLKGLDGSKVAALAGDLCDAESMFALKDLMTSLGSSNLDCRQDGAAVDPKVRASYLFNSTIAGIDKADAILLVGTNPRWEAPVINARIRKRYLKGGLKLAAIGPKYDLSYPVEVLGAGAETLAQIAAGTHAFADVLKNAKAPMLIVGMGALARPDGAAILASARAAADSCNLVREGWNGFNVLQTAAGRVAGLELGFVPEGRGRDIAGILEGAQKGEIEFVYLLGADEIDPSHFGKAFVVYQGHHGDRGAHRADVVLPGAAYTEKDATYMNTEGRAQLANLAIFPPGEAKEDWAIIRALSEHLGKPLAYDDLNQLRAKLYQANRRFQRLNMVEPAEWVAFGVKGEAQSRPFESPIANYYMTDPISRASVTMAECTEAFVSPKAKTGTHG
jgi:NADH-quinone oxidoreductase subunit G